MIKRLLPFLAALSISCVSFFRVNPDRTETGPAQTSAGTDIPDTPPIPTPESTPTGTSSFRDPDRFEKTYAIYDAILEDWYIGDEIRCIVLEDHSTVRHLREEDERILEYIHEHMPEMPDALWTDFIAQNQSSVPLSLSFGVNVPIILLSRDEISEFFSEGRGGWEGFYETYEGAQGIAEFSQAGFDADGNHALVYTGNQSAGLAGAGFLILMEKHDGVWGIEKNLMVWIS